MIVGAVENIFQITPIVVISWDIGTILAREAEEGLV